MMGWMERDGKDVRIGFRPTFGTDYHLERYKKRLCTDTEYCTMLTVHVNAFTFKHTVHSTCLQVIWRPE